MNEQTQNLRPIGTTFERVIETETERVISIWKVIGHSYQPGRGMVEITLPVDSKRTPKEPPGGTERKSS